MFGFGKKRLDQKRIEFLDLTMLSIRDLVGEMFADPDLSTTAFISGILWSKKLAEETTPVTVDEKRGFAQTMYDLSTYLEKIGDSVKIKENETCYLNVALALQVAGMAYEAQTYRETEIARKLTKEIFELVQQKAVTYPPDFLPIVTKIAESAIYQNSGQKEPR